MAIANLSEIETSLGLESGKLSEMMTSEEEHTLDMSQRVFFDKSTYDERVGNIKKESSNMASEIFIKELRNAFSLEFEGKTKENLIEAFKTKIQKEKEDGIKDPEARYTTLKTDFEQLQSNYSLKVKEIETINTTNSEKDRKSSIQSEVFKYIPENALVSKNTIMIEAEQKGFKFDIDEGKMVVRDSSGNILKNETSFSPTTVEEFMQGFVTPFLPAVEGGAGGKDDTGAGKAGSFEAFEKEAEKNGWDAQKINAEIMKRTADGTLKM
jgi:hypothetical protein